MAEPAIPTSERKRDWVLSQQAFRDLLEWLDEGNDSAGERYLEIRRRLVNYFDRKNCHAPDDLADETLNRVARRLEEEGAITDTPPARYCYIVARFVFLESLRTVDRKHVSLEDVTHRERAARLNSSPAIESNEPPSLKEKRFDCLQLCLQKLTPENRELMFEYYKGEQRIKIENRRAIASQLGITMNALSIRTCRLRNTLEHCLRKCVSGQA